MKFFGKAAVMGVTLMASSAALAECPVDLPFDNLMDCIVEEGAGGEYPSAQILKELNKAQADGKQTIYLDADFSEDEA